MADSPRSRARPSLARLTIIGVVAFLVIDAVLIGVALSRGGDGGGGVPGPIPTFSERAATPTATPSATPASAPVIPSPRFLAATSDTQAWRATVGSCDGPATVIESTTDGGATWVASGPGDAGRALALSASDGSAASLVSDIVPDCEIGAAITTTAGAEWESADPVESFWIDPADNRVVQTPEGPLATPCATVRQLTVRGESVLILCDGALFERVAASGAWVTLPVPGALAVTTTDAGYAVAAAGIAECAGVSILSVAAPVGTVDPTPVGCVADETAPSEVTIAASGAALWLWSGDRVLVSGDGGATW